MPKSVNPKNWNLSTNKVFQVVASFSKRENQKFKDFLVSPFFNKSETITSLYFAILNQIETTNKQGFIKNEVWYQVFGDRPYNDTLFRKYNSDLLKLIEEFLFVQYNQEKRSKFFNDVLEYAYSKKIEPLYQPMINNSSERWGEVKKVSSDFYFQKYRFEWLGHKIKASATLYKNRSNFEIISKNLDRFYFIEKIKLICSALSHQQVISAEYEIDFISQIDEFLSTSNLSDAPLVSLYYYTYKLISNTNDINTFYSFKSLLSNSIVSIMESEALDLLVNALNFCTRKINIGDTTFFKEYFDLVQIGLDNNLFIQDGKIESWRFTNFVIVSIRMKNFDWAEQFIENYKKYLDEDDRDNMVSFNLARLYYNQKKYNQVLEILRNVEYKDLNYNLNSKMLMITTYYDTNSFDALDSFLESFRVYMNRHRDISTNRRKTFLNFIKFVKKMMRLSPKDSNEIAKIKQELIKDKTFTASHEWLMEKIAELEK